MPMKTALDLLQSCSTDTKVLSTGVDTIDELLQGGLRSALVSEICGEASAGKTQLCLQLLLQSALPIELGGLDGTACYICTEGLGAVKRLRELSHTFVTRYGHIDSVLGKRVRHQDITQERSVADRAKSLLDNIFIEQLYEADDLINVLQNRLPALLEEQNTKLVVIDSIAAVLRLESTTTVKQATDRSQLMFHLANCMRILGHQYNVIFVLTNQVTGNVQDNTVDMTSAFQSSSPYKPALGLSWANCINQRFMLYRDGYDDSKRWLEVKKSPYLAPNKVSFTIAAGGIAASSFPS